MCIQELHEAELAFKDVCDQIAKAERFFPVPGASAGNGISAPPRGYSRPLIPKVLSPDLRASALLALHICTIN